MSETTPKPASIGTCDKNGRKIAVGDTVRYMAGSRRHITQYYLVENVPAPDIFHAMKPDEPLENGLYVRLFELEQWGEVISAKE
jgi:hypothetical protein